MIRINKYLLLAVCGLPLIGLLLWLVAGLGSAGAILEVAAFLAAAAAGWALLQLRHADHPFETLTELTVPSASAATNFLLSAEVHWVSAGTLNGPKANAADLARAELLERARVLGAGWRPDMVSSAQHDLAAKLSEPVPEGSRQLLVWAEDVRLELSDADRSHLARLAQARRELDLWELKVEKEQRARGYLKDDALKTPDSALVWWLSKNDSEIERAVELSAVLAQLSDLASGRIKAGAENPIGQQLVDALSMVDPTARPALAFDLADVLRTAGFEADAGVISEAYGVQDIEAQVIDIGHGGRPPAADG